MPHLLTADGRGVDVDPATMPGVNPMNVMEANPAYRQSIDLPGRRFRVEGSKIWTLFIQGSMMF